MRKREELPEVEPVKLRPVHGIRPGVLILAALIAAVLLLFFIVCMLPGIVSGEGYAVFSLNTADTAIYMDGKYIGSSEGSVYRLPAGRHEFSFSVSGADAGSAEAEIPHRIFFTLFSHRLNIIEYEVEWTSEIEDAVTSSFASDTALWSAVISYEEPYVFPPLFSHFARNAAALSFDDVSDVWLYAAMHITSDDMYRDYFLGMETLEKSGVKYSSETLENINTILAAAYDGAAYSAKRADIGSRGVKPVYSDGFFSYGEQTLTMGSTDEIDFPASNEHYVTVTVPSFSIGARPVSEYEYALFVSENPYWSKDNRDELIADGMADENYLEGIALSTSVISSRPVRNISISAAEAYCEWLSEKTGRKFSLPSEAEWYAAALSAEGKPYVSSLISYDPDPSSPSAMMGQLWEFTSTPYIPLMRLAGYDEAIELSSLYPYDGHVVKGGSFINTPESVTAESVGVMDRAACSPYAGFRVRTE